MSKNSPSNMGHIPVLLERIRPFFPQKNNGIYLDATFGGGGHFFALLSEHPEWQGEAWDQDPLAEQRFSAALKAQPDASIAPPRDFKNKVHFTAKNFASAPDESDRFDFILVDLGVSSFQLDDAERGMSFRSEAPVDFRMNPESGYTFRSWLKLTPEIDLARIFEDYGEEPKAKKLARAMKSWPESTFTNARAFADQIAAVLAYSNSRVHPATRAFQALRIAINDEMGALKSFLEWAPQALTPGGRLAALSFHSLEDRLVKNRFRDLAKDEAFVILTKKPMEASEAELQFNPRARSAKLRVIERAAK